MTHSIEIVPLQCTDTGLRLRSGPQAATEYDVVARRRGKDGTQFLWRKPADTIEEAERIVADARDELGENTTVIAEMPIPSQRSASEPTTAAL